MRRLVTIFVLCFLWLFLPSAKAIDYVDAMPIPIKRDLDNYYTHVQAENYRAMLEDLKSLEYHLAKPTTETIKEDLEKYYLFINSVEKTELLTACRLLMAGIYFQQNDSVAAINILPDLKTFYCEGYLEGTRHKTPLCDFMEAYGTFAKRFHDNINDLILSKKGYDERVGMITDILCAYATMKRCIGESPYYTSTNMGKIMLASRNPYTNLLLHNAIYFLGPYGSSAKNNFSKKIDEAMPAILVDESIGACSVIKKLWPPLLGLDEETNHLAQYALDYALEGNKAVVNIGQNQLRSYDILQTLSEFGYGEATFQLGVALEINKYNHIHLPKLTDEEREKKAYALYKKAVEQKCKTANIRLAHCMALGKGCKEDKERAYHILNSLKDEQDFDKYGAYAYAVLLGHGIGGKNGSIKDIMESLASAGYSALLRNEQIEAREINAKYYEKYYK